MTRVSLNRFLALLAFVSLPAFAATELGTSTVSFTASGSPNWINGSWTATALDVSNGAVVEYWSLEVLAVSSPFGNPNYLEFATKGPSAVSFFLASCSVNTPCVGAPNVGAVSTVTADQLERDGFKAFVARLDPNDPLHTLIGEVVVGFPAGGDPTTASGMLKVSAFGIAAPVPEPSRAVLWASGLLLATSAAMARRRMQ